MNIIGAFRRNWRQLNPPVTSKEEDALKFGILGAANIASVTLYVYAQADPSPTDP